MRFGDSVDGNILNSISANHIVKAVLSSSCIGLASLSYMFMVFPCRVALMELVLGKNEVKLEPTWFEFLFFTSLINFSAIFAAMNMNTLNFALAMNGAVSGSMIGIFCPCAFEIAIKLKRGYKLSLRCWLINILCTIFGMAVLASGV